MRLVIPQSPVPLRLKVCATGKGSPEDAQLWASTDEGYALSITDKFGRHYAGITRESGIGVVLSGARAPMEHAPSKGHPNDVIAWGVIGRDGRGWLRVYDRDILSHSSFAELTLQEEGRVDASIAQMAA